MLGVEACAASQGPAEQSLSSGMKLWWEIRAGARSGGPSYIEMVRVR